ncbi:unnamed protein product, partial [Brachionus calyciflorus]
MISKKVTKNSYLDIDQQLEEANVIFTENDDEFIFGVNEAQLEQANSAEESRSLEDTNYDVMIS